MIITKEIDIEINIGDMLDESDVDEILNHYNDADSVKEWLLADQLASGIASWIADDDDMTREVLKRVKGDEQLAAMAQEILGVRQLKLPAGDSALIITALRSMIVECDRIASNAREGFEQNSANYCAVLNRIYARVQLEET